MIPDETTSRRDMLKAIAAAGAAGIASNSVAQVTTTQSISTAPSTTAATTATADAITIADVAAADKLAAREAHSDADRAMMLKDLETYRRRLKRFRAQPIDPGVEPCVHFDPRLRDTRIPQGMSSCSMSDGPPRAFDGSIESLAFASVVELARLIRARRISSIQLTRMYLDRLKNYGPRLLCVVNLTEDLALKQAARADDELAAGKYRGPLHGIPYGVKDLLATKGIPTTFGVSPFKDRIFDFDATVIERLERAGAVLVAKLSLGELAMGDVWFGGKTRNPWKPQSGSSGSSAGPAAATAAGLVGFSIGSETLGSIISPCIETGVIGLRPTWGRVSRYGAMPLTWTMDKLGPMCRGVEDCALVLHAVHGADSRDPTAADVPFIWDPQTELKSLRVGFDAAAFDWNNEKRWPDDSVKKIYQAAFGSIGTLVGQLKPIKLPETDKYSGMAGTIIAAESASSFADLVSDGRIRQLVQQGDDAWPNTFRVGSTVPASDYLRVQRLRRMLMREMADVLGDLDLYVTVPYSGPTLAFTNLTGHPSLITRCGLHEGRPKMIEFIGNLYREDAILRLGHAYEQASDWRAARPDVQALPSQPQ
jgi:Asp-tRNA(Asn)/Glu-tRNA(Gln) amidotransferase A subunit family amidase